ncbi:nSTAND1 domain-containing NTPase [Goodfellowiella coeruleoviolacea]|uniref:WD40 repeat n=1 Tax=Goodfellowiella coeruleoviolacea TaxID=334858 RepID=A0AAE3KD23_9PSEU|nr:hypothetical protein [Goodfellowiella coeruleoviolacea]MCP2163551.1 WD40 repeat [Goodfellowiella coeruleoviolacea]
MPRRERPLGAEDTDVLRFAADLRRLRDKAGTPTYRELSRRAHYSAAALSEAASGRRLPSLAVTLAFVRACSGDIAEWAARWRSVAAGEDDTRPRDEDPARSPYRGLAAFGQDDADWFFGRDELVGELLSTVERHRFVGVFGASGSGKSSLLRAGLLSRTDMPATVFTPGKNPLEECAVRLAALTGGSAVSWRADLAADPANLHLRIRQALVDSESDALVVVDQFEELFTLCAEQERSRFVRALTAAATAAGSRVRVVLGVRADCYGHFGQYPELVAAVRGGQLLVGSMTPDQLREAITGPAARAGLKVETALLARLMADATGRPAVLPLVSHALRETWRRRHGVTLTLAGYEAAGGIHHALARTAEDVYSALDAPQQAAAKQLFLRLTAVGDGMADTKRRIGAEDVTGDPDTRAVLDRLTQARLLVADRDGIEISHEALIRHWPRLADWLAEDREGLRVHQQLTEASHAWVALHRDPGALYRGARLALACDWAATRAGQLTAGEREFLNASVRARDDEAVRTRRRTRRLRQLVAGVVVFAVLTAATAVVAVQQRAAAVDQRNEAVFQQVLAEADRIADRDPSLSAQLTLLAHRMRPGDQSVTPRLLATQNAALATPLSGHTGNVYLTSFSPDGRTLATASEDTTVRLWDVHDPTRPTPLGQPLTAHSGWVGTAVFSPDGHTLATAGDDGGVRLWNVTDPAHPSPLGPPLAAGDGTVYLAAFSPDGRTLATATEQHAVRLWDVADPTRPLALDPPLTGFAGPVRSVAFSPDGRTLAAGGDDTTVLLWNVTDPGRAAPLGHRLTGHTQLVHSVAFSPDGSVLATASEDRTVRLWRVADGTLLGSPLAAHTGGVWSVDFSPDGRLLATAGADGTTHLWNVSAPAGATPLSTRLTSSGGSNTYAAEFSPDGRALATGSADGLVRLWSLPTAVLIGHHSDVHSVAVHPGNRLLATADRDAVVLLWDTSEPTRPTAVGTIPAGSGQLQSCSARCTRVRFGPDGRTLAVLSYAKLVQLWDVADPTHPTPLGPAWSLRTRYAAATLEFSPDGRLLATGDDEHSVQLWDLADPTRPTALAHLTGHTGNIRATRFSPDGRVLATASLDHTIRLWDITEPRRPRLAGQLTDTLAYLAFSPTGSTLASAGDTLRLWDTSDPGTPVLLGEAVTGHSQAVSSVVYGPDGRLAATASNDHTIRLWNVSDPTGPVPLGPPIDSLAGTGADLEFSRDGRFLVTTDSTNTVRLLDLDVDHAVQRICAVTHGALSPAPSTLRLPELEKPLCAS